MNSRSFYATTYVQADGVTTKWPFSFAGVAPDQSSGTTPYINPEDVKAVELYTDAGGNQVSTQRSVTIDMPNVATITGDPVAKGRVIKIFRQTELRYPLVDYRDLQSVSEVDLDMANRQAVFLAQEVQDTASSTIALDGSDNYDMKMRRLVNVATGVDDTDAVNMLQLQHAIRIPLTEAPIPALPAPAERANKVLTFDSAGIPILVAPASGSAAELAMSLARTDRADAGAGVVGNTQLSLSDVPAMKSLLGLTVGQRVQTASYHAGGTTGGALYEVVVTDPGWGIPLIGGLFAALRDDFCITKFGVVNNAVKDQTAELKAMATYADANVYEIDFLGYRLQTPDISAFTSARGTNFRGLTFYKVHKIKNLYIQNPKGVELTYGWTCIQFIPKVAGTGLFELENVTFDPHTPTYYTPIGEEDGAMCGFAVRRYRGTPALRECNYDFKYSQIHFVSPAVSYNINTLDVLSNNVEMEYMTGQYWGLYAAQFTRNLQANECHGWFRDDYHTASGRSLVTSLIHDEPEIGTGSVELGDWEITNCSSRANTTGYAHITFKHHSVGTQIFNSMRFVDIVGSVELYATTPSMVRKVYAENVSKTVSLNIRFDSALCVRAPVDTGSFNTGVADRICGTLTITDTTIVPLAVFGTPATTLQRLVLRRCTIPDATYGIGRTGNIEFQTIEAYDCDFTSPYIVEAPFRTLLLEGCRVPALSWANAIHNRHNAGTVNVTINNMVSKAKVGQDARMYLSSGALNNINIYHSVFAERPSFQGLSNNVKEFSVFPVKPADHV